MKYILISLLTLVIHFSSCKKENTPTIPAMDAVDSAAQVKFTGAFINGPYGRVSGTALINYSPLNKTYSLVLKDMNISNGPDLYVYLSKEVQPVNFFNPGQIKISKRYTGVYYYRLT